MNATIQPQRKFAGKVRLMEAAAELFAKGGFNEVSVAQILERGDLKAPSLYHHYGDKEGLYVAWVVDAIRRVGEQVRTETVGGKDLSPRLVGIAKALLREHRIDLLQVLRDIRLLRREASVTLVENTLNDALYNPIKTTLAEAMAEGTLRREPLDRLTRSFVYLVMGAHPHYRLYEGEVEDTLQWLVQGFVNSRSAVAAPVRSEVRN